MPRESEVEKDLEKLTTLLRRYSGQPDPPKRRRRRAKSRKPAEEGISGVPVQDVDASQRPQEPRSGHGAPQEETAAFEESFDNPVVKPLRCVVRAA